MKKFAFIAVSTLLLASCSEENAPVNPAENQAITLSISEPVVLSRTVTSETGNVLKTTFVAGDKIGVSATGGASATNAKFTVSADGTSLTTETPINFQFNTEAVLTAYTPYAAGESPNVTFTIKPDQTVADDFNASNFMTSKATVSKANPTASLTFSPRMTLVYVEMAGALGVNATNLKLRGIKPSLTWTASTDAVVAEGGATDVTMHKAADKSVFMAFIPAQTTTAGEQLFAITIGSDSYSYKPTGEIAFKEGTVKRFKLTVSADQTVNIESSVVNGTDWTNDGNATENESGELTRNYLELISVADGTFTGKTLNPITGLSGAQEGWNALIAGTDNSSTITIENDAAVIATNGGSWYQRALYFRAPNNININTAHKFQLKFEVKGGTDIQVAVMRGQETGTFTSNAYFAVAGNTAAKVEKTEADYTTKTLEVDLSKISTGNVDFSTGIGVIFYAKDDTEQTHYIKNVSLIEIE